MKVDSFRQTWTERTNGKTLAFLELLVGAKNSGGQQEEEHGVVIQLQPEHHQSYLMHYYQNATIQNRQIQCRKDQMQVSYVEKNMVEVEQSSTVPNSQSIRST